MTNLEALWDHHHAQLRDPAQVISQWDAASHPTPDVLRGRAQGGWWDLLAQLDVTLLVTREYEHLVVGLSVEGGRPAVSYLPVPHPSGLAVDRKHRTVHIASTRNPNQVFELAAASRALERGDFEQPATDGRPLVPVSSRFYPGSLYLHDLAFVGGELHANAVGHNAVARLGERGYRRVWWPSSIERDGVPDLSRNLLQLNSIAAGEDLSSSYFSASSEKPSARRPGHLNYPVNRRGVIFSGATREPIVRGLTRPHSARLHRGRLWVANSGYGEVATVVDRRAEVVSRLPGWTRGLCLHDRPRVAFAGTSRVIPRFRRYAPGLDVDRSVCGVHAIDVKSGRVLGSYTWPLGNQIFALELLPRSWSHGLPFRAGTRGAGSSRRLFYSFDLPAVRGDHL